MTHKGIEIKQVTDRKLSRHECQRCGYRSATPGGVRAHITKVHDPAFSSKRWDSKTEPEYHI